MPPSDHDRRQRFEAAAQRVVVPVQRFIRRRAPHDLADDVLADTLLALWRRLDDIEPGQELLWTYAAARRCLANHLRSRRRHLRLIGRLQAEPAPSGSSIVVDPELAAALSRLRADDVEVLRLWAWEQLDARDIGSVLGITANAAAVRLHRARRRLASQLTGKDAAATGHMAREHAGEG